MVLTTHETTDERLVHEMYDEAIYQGFVPQWGSNWNYRLQPGGKSVQVFWIEVNCDQAQLKKIERAAKKLVERARTIDAAKKASMESGAPSCC